IGIREEEVLHVSLAHVGQSEYQAVGILVRERTQEDGVGDAEDRGAGADSEGDGQDGGGREDGTLAESPERVQNVAKQHGGSSDWYQDTAPGRAFRDARCWNETTVAGAVRSRRGPCRWPRRR